MLNYPLMQIEAKTIIEKEVYTHSVIINLADTTKEAIEDFFHEIRKLRVTECQNCGKSFSLINKRSDTRYCEQCSKTGATQVYKKKVQGNEILKLYNREYQRQYSALRSHEKDVKKKELTKLNDWIAGAKEKMSEKDLLIEEFEEWLRDNAVFPRKR